MTAKLRVVGKEPKTIDIYGPWRAEIATRDWAGLHVAGDKREPLFIPDVLKRIWRG